MLSQDEMKQIMLHLDIHDLQALCSVHNQYYNICQDDYFWKTKIDNDGLPLYNNPKTINDYLKIKIANDMKMKYAKKNYFIIEFNTEDLSKVLPNEFYEKIRHSHVDKIKLYIHYLHNKIFKPDISYISFIDNKRKEVLKFNTSHAIILNMLFEIFYYYPNIKISETDYH